MVTSNVQSPTAHLISTQINTSSLILVPGQSNDKAASLRRLMPPPPTLKRNIFPRGEETHYWQTPGTPHSSRLFPPGVWGEIFVSGDCGRKGNRGISCAGLATLGPWEHAVQIQHMGTSGTHSTLHMGTSGTTCGTRSTHGDQRYDFRHTFNTWEPAARPAAHTQHMGTSGTTCGTLITWEPAARKQEQHKFMALDLK